MTVELYVKWYSLFLVRDGVVSVLDFHDMEEQGAALGVSTYVDHCPNPAVVEAYCGAHGYEIPELALELIIGRWVLEGNRYEADGDSFLRHKIQGIRES